MSGKFSDHIAGLVDERNRKWAKRMEGIQPLIGVLKDMRAGSFDAELTMIRPVEASGLATGSLEVPTFHVQVDSEAQMNKSQKYDIRLEANGVITLTHKGDERPCVTMDISTPDGAERLAAHIFDGAARNFERTMDSDVQDRTFKL